MCDWWILIIRVHTDPRRQQRKLARVQRFNWISKRWPSFLCCIAVTASPDTETSRQRGKRFRVEEKKEAWLSWHCMSPFCIAERFLQWQPWSCWKPPGPQQGTGSMMTTKIYNILYFMGLGFTSRAATHNFFAFWLLCGLSPQHDDKWVECSPKLKCPVFSTTQRSSVYCPRTKKINTF